MMWNGRASQGDEDRAGQVRVERAGQAKAKTMQDNAGRRALQEKVQGTADCAQGGGQGRADYK